MATTGGTRYKVIYDYEASNSDELTVQVGQTVFVTEELAKGWVRGYIGDQVGMFPAAYAEPDTSSYGPPSAALPTAPAPSSHGAGNSTAPAGAETAVALEDLPSKDASQLALVKDQLVIVLRKFPTGWASGESQGKTGMFPLKSVRIVDLHEAASLRAAAAASNPSAGAGAKKAANKEKRMSRARSSTLSSMTKEEDEDDALTEGTPATVLFNYPAADKGQISLIAGETVTVLDKLSGGWWKGRTEDGDVGFFPGSYVREQAVPPSGSQSAREPSTNGFGPSGSAPTPSTNLKRASTVSKPSLKKATALFKYTAKSGSELSFDVGDEVLVFPVKDGESSGWWTGALASSPTVVAHFPASYVKLIGGSPDVADDSLPARSATTALLSVGGDKSNKRKSQPAQRAASTSITRGTTTTSKPPVSKPPSRPDDNNDSNSHDNSNSVDTAAIEEATRVSEQTKQGLIKLQQQSKTVFDGLLARLEQSDKDRARLEHAMREMHKMIQAGEASRNKLAQQNQVLYQQVNDLKAQVTKLEHGR